MFSRSARRAVADGVLGAARRGEDPPRRGTRARRNLLGGRAVISGALKIGIDVGGTFTDLVAMDDASLTAFIKSPSTPADQSIGVLAGLEALAARLGLSLADMLARTERIVHGTTVSTNALIERKGARVALLTTEGHRDVLEMREGLKDNRYDLRSPPPEPLVPRERRFAVRERLRPDGSVLTALDHDMLGRSIRAIAKDGATSVAVCYLHAYKNPSHEIETLERLRRDLPEVQVSVSSDVLPQIKEYERVSTTVVNAYVQPDLRKYLRTWIADWRTQIFTAACSSSSPMAAWHQWRRPRDWLPGRCCPAPRVALQARLVRRRCLKYPISCPSTWAGRARTFP